jgi:hypothetical protein
VKVVEGSEIYNFPIHTLVHFSCKKIEFSSLEQGQSEIIPGRRDVARAPTRQSAPPRAPYAASTSEPPRTFPRLVPRGHARPKAASKSPLLLAPRADRPANAQRTAGSFHAFPAVRSSLGRRLLLEASPSDRQSQAIA